MRSKLLNLAVVVLLCSAIVLPYIAVPCAIYAIVQHFGIKVSPMTSIVVGSFAVWAWAIGLDEWRKASWSHRVLIPFYPLLIGAFMAVHFIVYCTFVFACWLLGPFYLLGRWIFKKATGRELPTITEKVFPTPKKREPYTYAQLFGGSLCREATRMEKLVIPYKTHAEAASSAHFRARKIVEAQIKSCGHHISDYNYKTVMDYTRRYVADRPELIDQPQEASGQNEPPELRDRRR
jgi:hypothetical protein